MKIVHGEYIESGTFVAGEEGVFLADIKRDQDVVVISKEEWDKHLLFLDEIYTWMIDNDLECGPHGSTIAARLEELCKIHNS